MIKTIVLSFLLDFQISLPPDLIKIELKEAKDITRMVNDPYRGLRKADGLCDMLTRAIIINKTHWDKINDWQKRELLYHELGHCILSLPDNNGYSIMNPTVKTIYNVKSDGSNWNELVDEMKSRHNKEKR